MKNYIAAWTIAAGLLLGAAIMASAQDNSATTQQQTTTTSTSTTTTDNSATPAQSNSATLPDKESASTPSEGVATQDTTTPDRSADVRTVTGCLQKGEGASEYQLTGHDGSTWELHSDAVDLASHVGQTVTITGAVRNAAMHGMKEDAKREAQEHDMDKSATEHGHMTVTRVRTVSGSCS
jgi:cytoskeletal protein RodZ